MARSLEGRIERLENSHGRECSECGSNGDLSKVVIEVIWEDLDGEGFDEEGPEYCPKCGQQLTYVVTWMDLEEGEPWD